MQNTGYFSMFLATCITYLGMSIIINHSLKGHSVAPAHPDGLPKEQGVKRAKYFHTREGSKK